jgi:hypothetical protein
MVGPSGADKPSDQVDYITDPFRVFSALSQGDPDRAASIIVRMGDVEFADLRRVAHSLDVMSAREAVARQGVPDSWQAPEVAPLPIEGGEHYRQVYPSNGPGPLYACATCRDADEGLVPWPCPPAAASLAVRR